MKAKKVEREKVRSSYSCGACGADVAFVAQYCPSCGVEFSVPKESIKDGEVSSLSEVEGSVFALAKSAIAKNDLAAFDKIIQEHPESVGWKNGDGETLLTLSVYSARKSMVSLLLAAGADPQSEDNNGWTPLVIARTLAMSKFISKRARGVYVEMCDLLSKYISGSYVKETQESESLKDEFNEGSKVEELRELLKVFSSVSYVGMGEDPESGKKTYEVIIESPGGVVWDDVVPVIQELQSWGKTEAWRLLIPAKRNFIVSGNLKDLKRVFDDGDFPSVVVYLEVEP